MSDCRCGGKYVPDLVRVSMSKKILFVDDEQNVLDSLRRQLRKKFQIKTALGGQEALQSIKKEGPFAVIVSDMRMPEMDGIQLLTKVRGIAPETVRMMLTGNADQETAVAAVNEGSIFRFMTKPCAVELLVNSLNAGLEQYRLVTAEKELLNKTLNGSIKVLSEILSLVNPAAFSRSFRIKNYVADIVKKLHLPGLWQYQIAASLSQIGCITLPNDIIDKVYDDVPLSHDEEKMFAAHPLAGARLLANIPRFEVISQIIANQLVPFEDFGPVPEDRLGKAIRLGAQILHLTLAYDQLILNGSSHAFACQTLRGQIGQYSPQLLKTLTVIMGEGTKDIIRKINILDLQAGMILNQDMEAKNGLLIASKGQEVSYPVMERLRNFSNTIGIAEPFEVICHLQ